MKTEDETQRYALCPDCGGRLGTIDHLKGEEMRGVGPWHCKKCGVGWSFKTNGIDVCDPQRAGSRWVPVTVKLVLPPQKEPIELTLHAHTHEYPNEPLDEHAPYFYESHTCPTNWMDQVVRIQIGDDADPHGLFEFASIAPGHAEVD